MRRRIAPVVLQCAALVGFVVSAWLVVQYQLPRSQMACGPDGGCAHIRDCAVSGSGLLTWPTLGILAYGALLVASLSSNERVRRWLPWMGLAAGVAGASLLALQKGVCGFWCQYCVVTDTCGLVAAVAGMLGRGSIETHAVSRRVRLGFGGAAALGLAAVAAWAGPKLTQTPPMRPAPQTTLATLPEPIAREQRPGVATIVEFADFECPFCRRQHEEMKAIVASYGPRVRLVRKHVPLGFHRHAADAARAACCAEEQGHGDEMAARLFESEDITPEGCARIASGLGLDMGAYNACLEAPRTQARLDHDHDDAAASDVQGLPTMFVGHQKFLGVVDGARLRGVIDRALQEASASAGPRT